MKRILCFGDSNTWGYIPESKHERYTEHQRWTKLLQKYLGNNFEIIEEGLNSRTLISEDERPGKEGRNGSSYLIPCLDSHDPLDVVIIMLGTNELKSVYNQSVKDIVAVFDEKFIKIITTRKSQFRNTIARLIIIAPPPIIENTDYSKIKYDGAAQKREELSSELEKLAQRYQCSFISTNELEVGFDGVHLTEKGHKDLAEKILPILDV